jgi:hypothetical protein
MPKELQTRMSVEVGDVQYEGDTRERSGVGRTLLGSVVFRWTGLAVDWRQESNECGELEWSEDDEGRKILIQGRPNPSIFAARIRGPVLTCQRWPWLPARQMK